MKENMFQICGEEIILSFSHITYMTGEENKAKLQYLMCELR